MRIAVASGKGGTGKTTIATSLAEVAAGKGLSVAYLDCDVEEPNGHIFLKPKITSEQAIEKPVPTVEQARCNHCGECTGICQFGAIASLPKKTVVFAELCHACGGCRLVCPTGAITESTRGIGALRHGTSYGVQFADATLNIGEAMSPPAIHAVRESNGTTDWEIVDAPPGTSCPAIEAVRGCDRVVLVTEPTPFGLHDLKLAVQMVIALGLSFGVVINRCDIGDDRVHCYCQEERIPIWAEIPDDRRVAEAYSRGEMPGKAVLGFAQTMEQLLHKIETP